MLGGVLWRLNPLCSKVLGGLGLWGMVNLYGFGGIGGFRPRQHTKWSHQSFSYMKIQGSEFIDPDVACWKGGTLDAIFLPHEAELIKSIPISLQLSEDKLIWALTSNGVFSARSAYRLAMDQVRAERSGSSSNNGRIGKFWRQLRRLEIPHKVHHFAWRAVKGLLPTKVNLVKRGVIHDD